MYHAIHKAMNSWEKNGNATKSIPNKVSIIPEPKLKSTKLGNIFLLNRIFKIMNIPLKIMNIPAYIIIYIWLANGVLNSDKEIIISRTPIKMYRPQ